MEIYPITQSKVITGKGVLSKIEQTRLKVSNSTTALKKTQLGQFLTPANTAKFMAGLFPKTSMDVCRLLDPGAGIGSLTSTFIERCTSAELLFKKTEITAFEIDELLHKELENTLLRESENYPLTFTIYGGDFISEAVNRIKTNKNNNFTHAIINPPYKKINSNSAYRSLLREAGIETVNLYSAFVGLTINLMAIGGIIVAIIPRSFCNGPYYRSFRKIILDKTSIKHIHLFESRNKAFKDDDVLQENIIIMLERGGIQGDVNITTSHDDTFCDLNTHSYSFDRIVSPNDEDFFIHVPTSHELTDFDVSTVFQYSLSDIGVHVSTGPVVDFRTKENLCTMPQSGSVPLLYPIHFNGENVKWPIVESKKCNAIMCNNLTESSLYKNGFYCLVKRFSSKEEKRRIVACVSQPETFNNIELIGFENHLNVFHFNKSGLSEELARGLVVYLNSTVVDNSFRSFNGHTQVNVTDLKKMKYPSRSNLITLGRRVKSLIFNQETIDKLILELL